jgi:hypothetical protein
LSTNKGKEAFSSLFFVIRFKAYESQIPVPPESGCTEGMVMSSQQAQTASATLQVQQQQQTPMMVRPGVVTGQPVMGRGVVHRPRRCSDFGLQMVWAIPFISA